MLAPHRVLHGCYQGLIDSFGEEGMQLPLDHMASHDQPVIEGRGAVATALLCETLLSMVPHMTSKDQPYKLDGVIEGRGAVATALLCETLLSMVPHDMPSKLGFSP